MTGAGPLPPSAPAGPRLARRRPTPLSSGGMATVTRLAETVGLPVVIEAAVPGINLPVWVADHRALIERSVLEAGGVLFRGFRPPSAEEFLAVMAAVSAAPMEYRYRSTPRHAVHPGVYTSTEYPSSQTIPLHNEMAYAREWPGRIAFCCVTPALQGGETPICDSRVVLAGIPAATRARFEAHGVMYVRCYRPGIDLPWQEVFQTDDRDGLAAYCDAHAMAHEWRPDGTLMTRQVCQATVTHPHTGEAVWFNQAHLFHVSALDPRVREALLAQHGEDGLPRNAYYGDGSAIDPGDLAAVRDAYRRAAVLFPWRRGDVLLLDNLLAAHGRQPFDGPREVVVAMADPMP